MVVRADVVLLADGGDVTVGRDIATFVYGEFRVVIPEGREQVETDRRLQDGYIYRPSTDISPFDIGFARADATIDLEVQSTDLEVVVDQAQRNAEGDVFFEREITAAGLGEYTPGVDFVVGDVVSVELRGRRMLLPVREISMLSSESDGVVGWRVVVGGVLISDRDELRRRYDAVRRQVANDKRELARSAGRAASAASAAQSTADTARSEVAAVRESLAGEQAQEPDLLSQLVAVNDELQRLGRNPQPSLMLAFVALSTALWEAQQEIDAVQTAAIAENEARIGEIAALTDELVKTQQDLVARRVPVLSDGNDGQYFSRSGTTVTARGEWTGDVQVLEDRVGPRAVRIPNPEGGRTISLYNAGSWVTLLALVSQGVMRRFVGGLSTSLPSASVSWGYVAGSPSFTASTTGAHTIRAKVEWERAIYLATYGLRIVVGGVVVKTVEQSNIGPMFGYGVRSQMVTASDVMVNAGQKIELQVKADTGEGPAKWVRSLTLDVVWVEGA